jgi:hypothetical protein
MLRFTQSFVLSLVLGFGLAVSLPAFSHEGHEGPHAGEAVKKASHHEGHPAPGHEADSCSCTEHKCAEKCAAGDTAACKCSTCDCSKGAACDHGKCTHHGKKGKAGKKARKSKAKAAKAAAAPAVEGEAHQDAKAEGAPAASH